MNCQLSTWTIRAKSHPGQNGFRVPANTWTTHDDSTGKYYLNTQKTPNLARGRFISGIYFHLHYAHWLLCRRQRGASSMASLRCIFEYIFPHYLLTLRKFLFSILRVLYGIVPFTILFFVLRDLLCGYFIINSTKYLIRIKRNFTTMSKMHRKSCKPKYLH